MRRLDEETQRRVDTLEKRRDPTEIEWALSDASWAVRSAAVKLAAEALSPERLVELLSTGDDFTRRAAALSALGMAGRRALPVLLARLGSDDSQARLFCIQVLGKIPSNESLNALTKVARSDDTLVAQAAIESLGVLGDPRAVPILVEALRLDYWRAMAAVIALGKIGDPTGRAALEALKSDQRFKGAVDDALARGASGLHRAEGRA